MITPWPQPPGIIAFTGAALSREAGFVPFDRAAMPPGLSLEDVVTAESFARDPARVHEFYNLRRRQLLAAKPSVAHEGLAVLDAVRSREVLIVTSNIDDLHERAGSQAVIHLHGELLKARCTICGKVSERHDDIVAGSECPACGNAAHLWPHIAWVGEEPLGVERVYQALPHCRLFLLLGVPPASDPAADFLAEARRAGAHIVAFSETSSGNALIDEHITGPLAETVPEYVKELIAA